jgi:hypothetical protein
MISKLPRLVDVYLGSHLYLFEPQAGFRDALHQVSSSDLQWWATVYMVSLNHMSNSS